MATLVTGRRRQSVSDPTAAGRMNRKLETVLAYGAEFAAEIDRQLNKLPPPESYLDRSSQVLYILILRLLASTDQSLLYTRELF
jgi:hypothetical protein